MNFQRYQLASQFDKVAHSYLMEKEALNNLSLGILNQCLTNEKEGILKDPPPFFASVSDQDEPILFLIMTAPFNMLVVGNGDHSNKDKATKTAIHELLQMGMDIPGVIGSMEMASKFAEEWGRETKQRFEIAMDQGIYQLTKVRAVRNARGGMRVATIHDSALVSKWAYEFSLVTEAPFTKEKAEQKAMEFITDQSIYLWEDEGVPVSMARRGRSSANGITINFVYTPKVHRQKGYASACVAALSQALLDEGYHFCTLYTDLSNPTSNNIYRKIGYQSIGDSIVYVFQ